MCVVLAACGSASTASAGQSGNSTAACERALPGAHSAVTPVGFTDLPLPSDSVLTAPTHAAGGTGQFTLSAFEGCAPATSASALQSAFASRLAAQGWEPSQTFPSDGAAQLACGEAACWTKDAAPRFAQLARVTAAGADLVTFSLRLATPPSVPTCGPEFPTADYAAFMPAPAAPYAAIPLPPLSRVAPNDAPGIRTFDICSAGMGASFADFMAAQLPHLGWQRLSDSAVTQPDLDMSQPNAQKWAMGHLGLLVEGTDAQHWNIQYQVYVP
jgi:hypothetical protein